MIISSPKSRSGTKSILSSHGNQALILLTAITPPLVADLEYRIDGLDDTDRAFVDAAPSAKRRALRIAQLDLLQVGLAHLEVPGGTFALISDEQGRPHIILRDDARHHPNEDTPAGPAQSHLHLSVSHCADALAVALSAEPVGIDIERLRTMPAKPITHLFSPAEQREIVDDESFTKAWVRKEAYAKWLGTGLRDSLAEGVYHVETDAITLVLDDSELFVGFAGITGAETTVVEVMPVSEQR